MKRQYLHTYEEIISLENLSEAWTEFVKGKRSRIDVIEFEFHLMDKLIQIHHRLANGSYRHGAYTAFAISDSKPRKIHKASVADRIVHRAIYRQLYPFFDRTFIADSFSCRIEKGTHRALDRFRQFAWKVSQNHRRTVWVLKCDIRKFFASIDQTVLMRIIDERIVDKRIVQLFQRVVGSFHVELGKGLPLGNLTSQLLANVYMDVFDQFVKHQLQIKHYVRYADDFVFLSDDRNEPVEVCTAVKDFLWNVLRLELHPNKIELRTMASGIDFLGWIHFPDHRVLRTATKRRMAKALITIVTPSILASYQGLLKHGNTIKLCRCFRLQ